MDFVANFNLQKNNIESDFGLENIQFDAVLEINPAGASWGGITGNIENQTDLKNALDDKADVSTVENLSETVNEHTNELFNITNTIDNFGDIVEYNASDFASSEQGGKADTALQPNDNITELNNNAGFITSADLPTVNNSKITIQKNGVDVDDFSLNQSSNQTVNITVPTDTDDLTNGAGFITSADLPTVNNSTITFQKNGTTIETITLNQPANETVNFSIPTQASDINAVPITRTVNNKALSADISLDSSDVGALANTTTINDLTTTAQQNALNSGATTTNIGQIATNTSAITAINDKIPSEASSSNKLADKNFVNSSIATNTANFIGTFNSVADLEAYSGTLTNNDYAFVATTDSAGNTLYDRYKYTTATTPASWIFEYELNNSSFTSTQWSAINSGANTTNIGQIATNANDISNINTTIGGYGDIVTYNASSFATSAQGAKADTALQSGDNISLLTNDANYITNSDLSGYATENWVNNQGFITGINSSDVTNALGFTPYDSNNPDGFISGITSSDVTTALGYTPYNSSNPNGYTSNVGTVTSVNNVSPVGGNVTLSIPTVNDGILTITQNGTSKGTFSANQAGNDTISLTDTTYNAFTGADSVTGGASGLVPAPSAGDEGKFLKGDGTWDSISGGQSTDVQINGTSITSGGVANILTNSAYSSSNKIATMSDVPSTSGFEQTSNKVTSITSSSTDTQYPSAKSVIELLKVIYPVGSVYLSTTDSCPLSGLFGTWELVSAGKALWTGNGQSGSGTTTYTSYANAKANTTIAGALPDITGAVYGAYNGGGAVDNSTPQFGALYTPYTTGTFKYGSSTSQNTFGVGVGFKASKSSSVYKSSFSSVVPPSYVVNVWRRTA